MARFYGKIGFKTPSVETRPGYWEPQEIIERPYMGDILEFSKGNTSTQNGTNDDIYIRNEISIIADNYIMVNSSSIIYVEIMGEKWRVDSIRQIQRPRILLSTGGLYHV